MDGTNATKHSTQSKDSSIDLSVADTPLGITLLIQGTGLLPHCYRIHEGKFQRTGLHYAALICCEGNSQKITRDEYTALEKLVGKRITRFELNDVLGQYSR